MVKPILQDLADQGVIVWENHDIDEERDLAKQMEVRSVPTIIFYQDDEVFHRMTGYTPKDKILTIYQRGV